MNVVMIKFITKHPTKQHSLYLYKTFSIHIHHLYISILWVVTLIVIFMYLGVDFF